MAITGLKYLPPLDDGIPVADIAQQVINFEEVLPETSIDSEDEVVETTETEEITSHNSSESESPMDDLSPSEVVTREENPSSITEIKNNE
jgi:segregation and condensation protein B